MNSRIILSALLMAFFVCGCSITQTAKQQSPRKFKRVFCWGRLTSDEIAKKYQEIGVTDIQVSNEKQLKLALKYGITPYCGTFSPCGTHSQVMSPEEEKYSAYINGSDLKKMPRAKKRAEKDRRRIEKKHRYGGEPVASLDTINDARIPCWRSDKDYKLSKRRIDAICSRVKGVKGIFFDYIGYNNFKGCYCQECRAAYKKYLRDHNLTDTPTNKNTFYRDSLVAYYNTMIDYVKSKHPDFKVVVHIYPVFLPEPLYGNRTRADFCGQTVAWYFPWKEDKIAKYTRIVVNEQNKYFKNVKGIPFVGLNRSPGSLWVKKPATLEKELKTILDAGGDTLMVCSGRDMLKLGIFEVFKKYCGKDR